MADSVVGLCKTEVIHHRGPWRAVVPPPDAVEYAALKWVADSTGRCNKCVESLSGCLEI